MKKFSAFLRFVSVEAAVEGAEKLQGTSLGVKGATGNVSARQIIRNER